MTDKERLQYVLDTCDTVSIESIFYHYFLEFGDDTPITTITELFEQITHILDYKAEQLNRANWIACEKATYIKTYLEGNMWKDEETAKANLKPQIENAQAIIDACGRR